MLKIFFALAVLVVSSYFLFFKHKGPPKDVTAAKEVIAPYEPLPEDQEPSEIQNVPLYHVTMETASATVTPPSMDDLADAVKELEASEKKR